MRCALGIVCVVLLASVLAAPRRAAAVWGLDSATEAVKSTWKSGVDKMKGPPKTPADPNDPVSLSTKIKPATPEYYVGLAKLHERAGKNELARTSYAKALKLNSRHQNAMLGQARLDCREKRWNEAAAMYADAMKHHPTSATVANDAGLCYAAMGRMGDATRALRRAVELEPAREMYRNNLANVLIRQGQVEPAIAELKAVHGPALAHYNAGYLLQQTGQHDQATIQFQRALQMDPTFEPARQWLATLRAAPGGGTAIARDEPTYAPPAGPTFKYESPAPAANQSTNGVPRARLSARPKLPSQIAQEQSQPGLNPPAQRYMQSPAPTPETAQRYYQSNENASQPNYRQVEMLTPVNGPAIPRRY